MKLKTRNKKNENPVSIGLWVRRAKTVSEMNLCLLLSKILLSKKINLKLFQVVLVKMGNE